MTLRAPKLALERRAARRNPERPRHLRPEAFELEGAARPSGRRRVHSVDANVWFEMPEESVALFRQDLEGLYAGTPHTGNRYVDAVIDGRGMYLGKGQEGLVYLVGDKVVKVASTIPYQTEYQEHRTPEAAREMLRAEYRAHELLRGVPCVPEVAYVESADGRAWLVKPYVEPVTEPTPEEFAQVSACIERIMDLGVAIDDTLQVGRDASGRMVLYDLGFAEPEASTLKLQRMWERLRMWPRNAHEIPVLNDPDQTPERAYQHAADMARAAAWAIQEGTLTRGLAVRVRHALVAAMLRAERKIMHPDAKWIRDVWKQLQRV